jgi:hypothetical protein
MALYIHLYASRVQDLSYHRVSTSFHVIVTILNLVERSSTRHNKPKRRSDQDDFHIELARLVQP